ncbi:MAG: hypothetical protein ACLRMJ_01250 [Alistipes finegoldii]
MNEAIAELRAEGLHVAGLNDSEQEVVEQLRISTTRISKSRSKPVFPTPMWRSRPSA